MIISPVTYEERISWLLYTNYKYATEIIDFMERNPEFLDIGRLISLTEKPIYNSNAPQGIFETLIYYIAEAGVNANYGNQQWISIKGYMQSHQDDPLTNLSNDIKVQLKKQQVYADINSYLERHDIKYYDLTLDNVKNNWMFVIYFIGYIHLL
jgi:hypothetical protein